jgi:hypothetical protein
MLLFYVSDNIVILRFYLTFLFLLIVFIYRYYYCFYYRFYLSFLFIVFIYLYRLLSFLFNVCF